jgi:hypothetical protein
MNRIELFAHRLRARLSDAEVALEPPSDPEGKWCLGVWIGERALVIEWWPSRGFGLSSLPAEGQGEGPDEVYRDLDRAFERAMALLVSGGRTVRPREAGLKELRELRRVSQGQLATSLGMRQAAISKIEHREVLDVTLLRRIVASLGGELEIQARFPGYTVRLRPPAGGEQIGGQRAASR